MSDAADVAWVGGGRRDDPAMRPLAAAGVPLTGWPTRAATMPALHTPTVYLHWTGWDGLPLSVLEAMARDVVVVASDIGPNREVLGPDQVCATDQDAIALIRRLLADEGLYRRMLASQRVRRRRYGADRMVRLWERVYERVGAQG